MIQAELLKLLVCPEDHSPLTVASSELIARINAAIARGELKNRAGEALGEPLDAGLVRADNRVLYAVIDEIPMMLVDAGIPLDQPALAAP